ncbi:hypothetical protein V5O48_013865 [Marasmius crinis-equi]|uniref:Ribonuclease H1 N-terminal domain-containing protein n=1 Tax=Marasmius crinis-equi TaxID=585013 RepID=A0ABR3EYV6_9AGAR
MVQLSQPDNSNATTVLTTGAGAAKVVHPDPEAIARSTPNAVVTFSTGDGQLGLTETHTVIHHDSGWTWTTITTVERTQAHSPAVNVGAATDSRPVETVAANPAPTASSQATAVGQSQAASNISEDSDEYWSSSDEEDEDVYCVPLPTSYQRPVNGTFTGRWYVVFAGREVGVFAGDWEEVVGPLVNRVPHARHQAYNTQDDAVYQYARAYQGRRRRWEVTVLNPTCPVVYDNSYTFGSGTMLGSVDITGLDIDPSRVTTVV